MSYVNNFELYQFIGNYCRTFQQFDFEIKNINHWSSKLTKIQKEAKTNAIEQKKRIEKKKQHERLQHYIGKILKGKFKILEISETNVATIAERVISNYDPYNKAKLLGNLSLNFKYEDSFKDKLLTVSKGSHARIEGEILDIEYSIYSSSSLYYMKINLKLISIENSNPGCFFGNNLLWKLRGT